MAEVILGPWVGLLRIGVLIKLDCCSYSSGRRTLVIMEIRLELDFPPCPSISIQELMYMNQGKRKLNVILGLRE